MHPLPPIVSAEWLAANLPTDVESETDATTHERRTGDRSTLAGGDGPRLRVADVRWYLDGRSGHEAYLGGHIPGAVFIDLDTVLAAPATAAEGRHPLPEPGAFARGLAAAGVRASDAVVAYDDLGGMVAGRLVWMLRVVGAEAALLDGGLPAWVGPLRSGAPTVTPVERDPVPWPADALATADEVAAATAAGSVVIDARAPERYRGETEPVDPRAGHIPGAVNLPFAANLDERQQFLPTEQLAERFSEAGADENAIVYCGSGVSACHNVLAMEAAGLRRPRLFVGSWSQWSSDDTRPAAVGD